MASDFDCLHWYESSAPDRAAETDKKFFARFPDRRHRVRRAHRSEIDNHGVAAEPLPQGSAWFVVIRRITPRVLVQRIVANAKDTDTDLSERLARLVFELVTTPPGSAEQKRAILAAAAENERPP